MTTGTRRTHVVVIFGGESAEHDVSCVTAAHVLRALDPARYEVTAVGITRGGEWVLARDAMRALESGPAAIPARLEAAGDTTHLATVVAPRGDDAPVVAMPLLHGPMGEDGTVQGLLELAHVPYVGAGVLGSAIAMDKAITKALLGRHGLPQPEHRVVRDLPGADDAVRDAVRELGVPVFVKPANMGSSVGVEKARTPEEAIAAARRAFAWDEWVLVEEAVAGREIEVAVLGNESPRASVPGEIVPSREFYDYEDKYVVDGARLLVPAPLDAGLADEVRRLAIEVFRAVRADGMARVDFFLEEGGRGFLVNEINTIPGFTPISMYPKLWQASGLTYAGLVDELIALALARHARRRRTTTR
ncbi:MAG: D-alanine--D-alanine ligase [Actinomycetota bacterium]|jgi:D-alanine-D-alanine ligase